MNKRVVGPGLEEDEKVTSKASDGGMIEQVGVELDRGGEVVAEVGEGESEIELGGAGVGREGFGMNVGQEKEVKGEVVEGEHNLKERGSGQGSMRV